MKKEDPEYARKIRTSKPDELSLKELGDAVIYMNELADSYEDYAKKFRQKAIDRQNEMRKRKINLRVVKIKEIK